MIMNIRNRTKSILAVLLAAIAVLAVTTAAHAGPESDLLSAISALKGHVDGSTPLSDSQIANHKATVDSNKALFGTSVNVMTAAFDLVETYDAIMGPLWVMGSQMDSQWDRREVTDDIHWTIYHVMQYIMDYTYTNGNLASYETLLGGFKFGSADNFPGHVDPPVDPEVTHTATINASFPNTFGHETMHETDRPARKPTGTYLAPGTVATVTVPASLVNNGYQILVGAHSLDLSNRPFVRRLDRSSLLYDVTSTEMKISSPLGGGIYIEVPYLASAGVVDIQIKNMVRSPYYSYNTVTGHITTLKQWQTTERNHQAPWADFQSEKFIMQVPTSWIYALDDPVTLMADWDKAMDACNDLMGYPHIRGKEPSYDQVDVIIDAGAYSPGYPTVNNTYDPHATYNGYSSNYLVRGPQYAPSMHFHEIGHSYLFVKFPGEVESVVNLLHVPVWHQKFGYDLDYAFAASRGHQNNPHRTLDNTAVCWMMCQNFKNRVSMEQLEKQYQLKGHAKFVDTARLFGWEACNAFWYSINVDYENGIEWSRHDSDIDDLLLRWCEEAGVDLRPLFHFWGTPPVNASSLEAEIEAANLPASNKIYDTLVKYKSFIPSDNATYQDFAFNWWEHPPSSGGSMTEQEHALLWDTYDTAYADIIRNNVQYIIDLYFPDGRPLVDIGEDMITWSGKAVQMNPSFNGGFSATSFAWTAEPVTGVAFTPNANVESPTVTVTKATANPSVVTIMLDVDGPDGPEEDTMTLDVYDTACKAAIGKGLSANHPTDIDGNCITDFRDFAILSVTWLDNDTLTGAIIKP